MNQDTYALKSSRSALFPIESEQSVENLNAGFFQMNVQGSTDAIFKPEERPGYFSLPRMGGQTDMSDHTAPFVASSGSLDTGATMRNIWSPVKSVGRTNIQKSASSATLICQAEPSFSEVASAPAPVSINTNQIVSVPSTIEMKELKANFKSLVEKIVKTNDQPCSIYLQQRLKSETEETKAFIFEAIMNQLLPLMKNRFGNFLVQAMLENGSENQFLSLCLKMKGHVVQLAGDRFGCHVMQKVIWPA